MSKGIPGEDFEAYLEQVRRFTAEVLIPNEARLEADDGIPEEIVQQMRDIGLFSISIPEAYGGSDCSMEQQVRLTFEFTQAASAYRSRFSTTIGLCSQAVLDHGTDEQRLAYLPGMASGDITGAFCLTEPDRGSDAGALKTRADKDGGDYVLNGTKRFITNAPDAEMFLVMARTDSDSTGAEGISAFIVDAGTTGLEVGKAVKKMGQAGSNVAEVYFSDCRVPASALLGAAEGNGLKAALRGINHARTHVAATCVGQAMRLIDEAVAYALEREQFGRPIAEFQLVQGMLAECRAEMAAARELTLAAARGFDAGPPYPLTDIACAKFFASEMVCRVADKAVQIHGGMGYMDETPVARLYRDVRLFRIFEGTSEIQKLNIARAMLKEASD